MSSPHLFVNSRVQLTLFVPPVAAEPLEAARRILDPVQASLIAAHVTLCRDEEAGELAPAILQGRIAASDARPITLRFGPPERFGGHGILMPCIEGNGEFRALRQQVLGTATPVYQAPHITLAHPRNPRAPGNHVANIAGLASGLRLTFSILSRIRQEGLAPWQVLQEYSLDGVR